MSYETLEKEIKTLPESSIAELEDFVVYLKLKDKFADFEHRDETYENALRKWREGSKALFENAEDASFMRHAFDCARPDETYKAKEIWR